MKAEIKIIGYMDYAYKSDRCVYDTGGVTPTLRAGNHEVKILVERKYERPESGNNRLYGQQH